MGQNGSSAAPAPPTTKALEDELGLVQTPEALARASIAAAERLMGRPCTKAEVGEYSGWYEKVVAEFAKIAKER